MARASASLPHGGGASSSARISDSAPPSRPQRTQSSICLVECGSGICCAKKNSRKPSIVAAVVVDVALRPALVGVERHVGRVLAVVRVRRRQPRHERCDRGHAEHSGRIGRGEHERPAAAVAEAAHERLLGAARLQHSPTVGDVLPPGVGRGVARTVGPAVAPRVEDDHAEVAREVRHLCLPDARMGDRRGREEHERRRRVAVDLVEDADAVAFDVPLLVRVLGARLLVRTDENAHLDLRGSVSTNSRRIKLTWTGSRAWGR